ncbi:MAG TPA: GNAT family N-acetyltransferase [Anaerolineales bacterium]
MESIAREAPGSRVSIEPATWRDLNAVRHIEQVCFPQDAWPLWDVIGVLALPNVLRLKAVVGAELAGFVAADIRWGKKEAWIATIGVLPAYRGRGIAAALLNACEEQLQVERIRLCVRYSNTPAIRLYQQQGYTRIDAWRRYYADGEDAIVFEKVI